MSPRQGGEADKLGNKYEAAWAIRHALYCILDPTQSLTAEDIDPDAGQGSEFTYVSGAVEAHQLKRQNGNSNYWSIKALSGLGIFKSAAAHVAQSRQYHFASLIPCGPLKELADRARKSADLAAFTQSWLTSDPLRTAFDELAAAEILGSAGAAWTTLRGMWFEVHDEDDVIRMNGMLAGLSLEGTTGHLICLAIGDVLLDNLGKRLTRTELLEELAKHGITPLTAGSHASTQEQVAAVTGSWVGTVQRELLDPPIERAEVEQIAAALVSDRLCLITGTAGGGKSGVLEQTVATLGASGAEVLAFRLDRLEPFASTTELGRQLGLETSPAAALALAAGGRDAYLIIDQVDAVSLASGRMPQSFDVVVDLIGEALSVGGVRVILACREFDVENDHRIRALAARSDVRKVSIADLPGDAVKAAVTTMGLDASKLKATQLALLQSPLHLVLLSTIADQGDALAFQSRGSLFAAFWERKRQAVKARRAEVRFNDVIARVANGASDRQTLSAPVELLDEGDLVDDANVLVSEHVLARDGDRIAFFHETFFDYAFARQWVSRNESLCEFLLRDEQELFRRAQVRQILQHLHEREPERFLQELEELLTSPDIRLHIKETALSVFANLPTPTTEDADLALLVAATKPSFEERIWQQLRRAQWLRRFNADGRVAAWLDSGDEVLEARAINLMISGSKVYGDDVAVLLETRSAAPKYHSWVRWVLRFADVHTNRRLFEIFLANVRAGAYSGADHELWLTAHELAKHEPGWAIELLRARFVDQVGALALDSEGKVAALTVRDYQAAELICNASAAEPLAFIEAIMPYLLDVMAATEYTAREEARIADRHFTHRFPDRDSHNRDIDDTLLSSTTQALETIARSNPEAIRPLIDTLTNDPHDAAQFLLYRALTAGGETFAALAAELLLEGGSRLDCGYLSDADWVARELVKAIALHVSDDLHRRLEDAFRDLRNPYERRQSTGHSAFTFLSALDESRLSPEGVRRLGEFRRKFNTDEPPPPRGVTGGVVGSPISGTAAAKMTDTQWLGAMARYDSAEHGWATLKGGASELSHQLQEQVKTEPDRFARLALRLTSDLNRAYGDAILMGLGDATTTESELVFAAVRHIAGLGHAENDRWLGMALRRYYRQAPLDVVELVVERTLRSTDPADNSPVVVRDGDDRQAANLRMNGINTARGSLAEALGDLLVYDSDGERTRLVVPHLVELANDPILSVRSCVAHTIAACLRYARPEAISAFQQLIDTEDLLLAAELVQRLMLYIGNVNPEVVDPVIQRMLSSEDVEAREAGGQIAAFAALEWQRPELMDQAMSLDARVRQGVAQVCSRHVDRTSNAALATTILMRLMNDEDDEVRKAAAEVAPHLREHPLRPFADLLEALIDSPSYEHATPQLLLTLEYAPDKVDDLALKAAQRFLKVYGEEAGDLSTSAAGDAHYISELVVRGLAQSRNPQHRAALLDVLDSLLELGVYGIGDAIAASERL
ncbi:hypothetical protein BWI15_12295 [Kribbella sp. ALI-6-A]|uniref:hypothetical protein n=1 Tax=Kribbella sp. ALI-6-A TaxID=1933817 RepID=UPI00097C4091|nr:hypothetical protein [Kribbella sp. ALI-6-A]ONI74141.1 hypothetical protein BWI15_12295 [Kribbella sp. ALI-6-A]